MQAISELVLDVTRRLPVRQHLNVVRRDHGTRILHITLTNDGVPLEIPEGTAAMLCVEKADGTQTVTEGEILDNTVAVALTAQTLAAVGTALCEVQLLSGSDVLTSATFELRVLPSVIDDEDVQSSSEFSALAGAVAEVLEVTEDAKKEIETLEGLKKEIPVRGMEGKTVEPTQGETVTALQGSVIMNDTEERTYNEKGEIAAGNVASGYHSVAMGRYNTATGDTAVVSGSRNKASGASSIAGGYKSEATGEYAIAVGNNAVARAQHALAKGHNITVDGEFSVAMGRYAEISKAGLYAFAMGYEAKVTSRCGVAMGKTVKATGEMAVALGSQTVAGGTYAFAMGDRSEATGTAAAAIGILTKATGNHATAVGNNAVASGGNSIAGGYYCEANASCGVALGCKAIANGANSVALGHNVIANAHAQLVHGTFNLPDENMLHIVGNGSSESNRKNAYTLDKNGNGWFAGGVTVGANKDKLLTEKAAGEKFAAASVVQTLLGTIAALEARVAALENGEVQA